MSGLTIRPGRWRSPVKQSCYWLLRFQIATFPAPRHRDLRRPPEVYLGDIAGHRQRLAYEIPSRGRDGLTAWDATVYLEPDQGHGRHLSGRQVDDPDDVVVRIGDVEDAPGDAQTSGLVEGGFLCRSVN